MSNGLRYGKIKTRKSGRVGRYYMMESVSTGYGGSMLVKRGSSSNNIALAVRNAKRRATEIRNLTCVMERGSGEVIWDSRLGLIRDVEKFAFVMPAWSEW